MESEKETQEKIKTTLFLVIIVSFVSNIRKRKSLSLVGFEAGTCTHVCVCARLHTGWLSDLRSQFVSLFFTALSDLRYSEA